MKERLKLARAPGRETRSHLVFRNVCTERRASGKKAGNGTLFRDGEKRGERIDQKKIRALPRATLSRVYHPSHSGEELTFPSCTSLPPSYTPAPFWNQYSLHFLPPCLSATRTRPSVQLLERYTALKSRSNVRNSWYNMLKAAFPPPWYSVINAAVARWNSLF